MFDYEQINNLQLDLNALRDEMKEALQEHFPEGCSVTFVVRHGQKFATSGTVISHREDQVTVRMHTKAETVRDFSWKKLKRYN